MHAAPMVSKPDRRFKRLIVSKVLHTFTTSFFLYGLAVVCFLGTLIWPNTWLLRLSGLAYIGGLVTMWQHTLALLFSLKRSDMVTRLLALSLGIVFPSVTVALGITWFQYSSTVLLVALIGAVVISTVCGVVSVLKKPKIVASLIPGYTVLPPFARRGIWLTLFWVAVVAALVVIIRMPVDTGVILTPWQRIPPLYALLVGLVAGILAFLFSTREKTKPLLVGLIALSFLIHIGLPLSHALPWGGDAWRHLGTMEGLVAGDIYRPVLFGPEATVREVGPVLVPDVFLTPHKYAYSQMWGTLITLSNFGFGSFITLLRFFVPLVFSFLIPVLLFRIGGLLFHSWRRGLWFALLLQLTFAFQAAGMFTLPVSFGVLFFFLALWLWLEHIRRPSAGSRAVLWSLALFSVFFYPIYTILFWLFLGVGFCVRLIVKSNTHRVVAVIFLSIITLVCAALFPAIELSGKTSSWPAHIDFARSMVDAGKMIVGGAYAVPLPLKDPGPGNILLNTPPAFVPVFLLIQTLRLVGIPSLIGLIFFGVIGGASVFRPPRRLVWQTLFFVGVSICVGYLVGWFILVGDRSFVRRLDLMVAFFLFLFACRGWWTISKNDMLLSIRRISRIGTSLCVALVLFVGFLLGPDSQTMSVGVWDGMNQGVAELSRAEKPLCIIADTWPLLALEGASRGRIIGGGFPIDTQFGQPERVVIFREAMQAPRPSIIVVSHKLTQALSCSVVLPDAVLEETKRKWTSIAGKEPEHYGSLYIWSVDVHHAEQLVEGQKKKEE